MLTAEPLPDEIRVPVDLDEPQTVEDGENVSVLEEIRPPPVLGAVDLGRVCLFRPRLEEVVLPLVHDASVHVHEQRAGEVARCVEVQAAVRPSGVVDRDAGAGRRRLRAREVADGPELLKFPLLLRRQCRLGLFARPAPAAGRSHVRRTGVRVVGPRLPLLAARGHGAEQERGCEQEQSGGRSQRRYSFRNVVLV